jgi:porphobilinogen synthase
MMMELSRRPRRNRKSETIRNLVQEHSVSVNDLVFPMFLLAGEKQKSEVSSMPGIFRFSTDLILKEIDTCMSLGIKSFALFPNIPEALKDSRATESWNEKGLYTSAIKRIKQEFPEACIISDVAMDPYSSDGHDGIVSADGKILNDETLEVLGKMALAQARAGADIIGPSDMMDGRVGYIRTLLDDEGFTDVSIMSYTAKYASAFYGPFRDALNSAPKFGDKKTYQMDPANSTEALIEGELDVLEGADFLMVKPALPYLDVIKSLYDEFELPIAAYNVSGEYAMIKAAANNGWLDGEKAMQECLLSIKRAGAKIILTYFAKEYALLVK